MIRLVANRCLQAVPVLLITGLIAFCLTSFIGDPVIAMLGQDYTEPQRLVLSQHLGLDQPLLARYVRYLAAAGHGQFGVSYRLGRPVLDLLAERLPATLELAGTATILGLTLGIPAGIVAAHRSGGLLARLLSAAGLLSVSLPSFLVGLLLVSVFSVWLRWLPSFGRGETVDVGAWSTGFLTPSGRAALVLPAITLGSFQATLVMRLVQTQMQAALGSVHVQFARARGLNEAAILLRHALPTTLAPIISAVVLQLGTTAAFAIVTEQVFQWPGTGLLLVGAIQTADIPILCAALLVAAVVFLGLNLAADLACYAVDPRTRPTR